MKIVKLMDYDNKAGEYYSQSREEMYEFIPENTIKVLDVGCSEGWFIKNLKNKIKDLESWGVEPDYRSAKIAKKHLDKVLVGNIENNYNIIPKEKFDVIFFNDVLEHFIDPYEILSNVRKYLKKDGCIVASIPNVRYANNLKKLLLNKDWKYENEGILDRTHLRFFTKKSIERMFEECGYEVEIIRGINKSNTIAKNLFNIVTFGYFSDTLFLQFGLRAKKKI